MDFTMKRLLLGLALSGVAAGNLAHGSPERATIKARERAGADERNVTALTYRGSDSVTVDGTLDGSSPTFDRRIPDGAVGNACDAQSADSTSDGVPYAAFQLQVAGSSADPPVPFEALVQVAGTTLTDSVLYLYCDPFDDQNPDANLVFSDDDDGAGPNGALSAITLSDGVMLTGGASYWLVISTFGSAASEWGDFSIALSGASVTVVPVEIQRFSVE